MRYSWDRYLSTSEKSSKNKDIPPVTSEAGGVRADIWPQEAQGTQIPFLWHLQECAQASGTELLFLLEGTSTSCLHEELSVGLALGVERWGGWVADVVELSWLVNLIPDGDQCDPTPWAGSGHNLLPLQHTVALSLALACVEPQRWGSVAFILLLLPAHRHIFDRIFHLLVKGSPGEVGKGMGRGCGRR